ncbi:hypothetical protein PANDA_005656, partial [Ailuropoda melanoleuca]
VSVYTKPRYCARNPAFKECRRKCKYSWDCDTGYECCFSVCGKICLFIRQ